MSLENQLILPNQPYIFDIDMDSNYDHILLSDSSQSLSIIDISTFTTSQSRFQCHSDMITSIKFSLNNTNIFHSASLDKMVYFWDLRQSTCTFQINEQNEIYSTSIGLNDNLLAIGVGNEIHFYDLRNCGLPLGVYSDCHTDLITKVKFHPTNPSILLSSGEDGLICSFNTAVPPQHDAVVSIMNTECAVRDFGYFGSTQGFEGIYSISTIETLSLWHYPSAQRLSNYPNIRTGLGSDYLVNCWFDSSSSSSSYSSSSTSEDNFNNPALRSQQGAGAGAADKLYLLSGSHSGEGFLHEITPMSIESRGSFESASQSSSSHQSGGHNDTIRCVYPIGFNSYSTKNMSPQNIHSPPLTCGLLTGGEDGKLCLWRCPNRQLPPDSSISMNSSSSSSSPNRKGPASSSSSSSSTSQRSHSNHNRQHGGGGRGQDERNHSKQLRYHPY